MGTFHHDKDELHGITLALTTADAVYVGRCDDMDATRIILLDVAAHAEGDGGRSRAQWLERAAKFGVVPEQPRLTLPLAEVTEYAPLGDYYRGVGKTASQVTAAPTAADGPAGGAATVASGGEADADEVVRLTDDARHEVRRILAEEGGESRGLRLGVAGGGCSGLVYKAELDARRERDAVVDCGDFEIYLDPKSSIYLRGVIVDYQGGLGGRGFQFRNPNATNTCGCGESFSV